MKLSVIGLVISSTLCGCAVFDGEFAAYDSEDAIQEQSLPESSVANNSAGPLQSSLMFQRQFQNNLAINSGATNSSSVMLATSNHDSVGYVNPLSGAKLNINHYAQGLMQDLVANLQNVNSKTPVAVVSFVMLDSDYNQSSLLGNQMAESLIHEIHKFGIPVIDFKTTGFIRITEQGDFAFSKDYEELGDNLSARHLVGGTMLKHQQGYLVNARIVSMQTKEVVASAQSFIPNSVADALVTSLPTMDEGKAVNTKSIDNEESNKPTPPKPDANSVSLVSG